MYNGQHQWSIVMSEFFFFFYRIIYLKVDDKRYLKQLNKSDQIQNNVTSYNYTYVTF